MPTSSSSGDPAALHAILAFLITAFIPFLLLKYHKADASDPFHDNSLPILTFFIATLTYVAAMVTELKLRIHNIECPKVVSNISILSAPLASVSLVMILFPRLGWFLVVIWIGFFVMLAIDSYQEVLQLLRAATQWAHQLIWNRILRREEANQEESDHQSSATKSTTSCEANKEEIDKQSSATSSTCHHSVV